MSHVAVTATDTTQHSSSNCSIKRKSGKSKEKPTKVKATLSENQQKEESVQSQIEVGEPKLELKTNPSPAEVNSQVAIDALNKKFN